MSQRAPFPREALSWMFGQHDSILTISAPPSLTKAIVGNHDVTSIVHNPREAFTHPNQTSHVVVGAPTHLPFAPCTFDSVWIHQLDCDNPARVFSQCAQVLKPDGVVTASYVRRDDSVPWVQRFIDLVHTIDATAMPGDYDSHVVDALTTSRYFPDAHNRCFRLWIPVTMADLTGMIVDLGNQQEIGAARMAELIDAVRDLHHDSAPTTRLLLPYQLTCWKAVVSHDELTSPIVLDDRAVHFTL